MRTITRTEIQKRWNALKAEFMNGWSASYNELSTYINQKRGWFDTRPNRGSMIDHKTLLEGHATQANRILASGLLSGMTSPSRPWFRLTLDDVTLDSQPGAREWLDEVQRRMVEVMNGSNIYSAFYNAYEELGQFGTSCFIVLEDFDSVIRCRSYTAGEYYLSIDARGRVNGFARYFWMTVGQIVKEFGLESVSPQIKSMWENNQPDAWVQVAHLIEENDDRAPDRKDFKNMPWRSVYWEYGAQHDGVLATRGYRKFPVIATRWEAVTTDQIYGYGPGWYALGNVKQLQKTRLNRLLSEEKSHKPPVQQDASVEGHTNLLPGGVTKISGNTPNAGVRPIYQVQHDAQGFQLSEMELKQAIDKDFFVNLFLMLMNIDKTNMTATEIAERQQEKVMMMGPVLYRIQEELLDPVMELVFDIMLDLGLIPPPPESIAGMNIKIKYVSILAQAQQALGVEQINRVVGFVAQVAPVFPQATRVLDIDDAVREVASLEGIPKRLIKDKATVDAEIQAEQEQLARMQQVQMTSELANQSADTVKKLSEAKGQDGQSAMDKIVAQLPGR